MNLITPLPVPAHFDPSRVDDLFNLDFGGLEAKARAFAKQHGIKSAALDKARIALLPIDMQLTFCHRNFELYVKGAEKTSVRAAEFVYSYAHLITQIFPTFDTHYREQIFHPFMLIDDRGEHPTPGTMVKNSDLKSGKWRVNPAAASILANGNVGALQHYLDHYTNQLESTGRFMLIVWPYHAMLGSIGHALVPLFYEAIWFHSCARNAQIGPEIKGGNSITENYSIFRPEVLVNAQGNPIAQKNAAFFQKCIEFDAVLIMGQAKSHCVAWTIADLIAEIKAQDPGLLRKIYVIEDLMDPVIVEDGNGNVILDFTDLANQEFDKFRQDVNVVRSTDPMADWPGMDAILKSAV